MRDGGHPAAPPAASAAGPSRDGLLATLDQQSEGGPRVRAEDITAVRNMFSEFQEIDLFQGGGSGWLVLAASMNVHVYPVLRRAQSNDLDAVYAAGLRTLSLAGKVKSSRAVEAVVDLQKRMQPFGTHRPVADFTERARAVTTAA